MSLAPISSIYSDSIFSDVANQTTDALGNIFDAAGNHVGVVPGSRADLGTIGKTPAIAATPVTPTTNAIGILQAPDLSSLGTAIKSKMDGAKVSNWLQKAFFGIDLEDGLFILVGLLLIAAGLYGFSAVREVVNTAVATAGESAA
jgi:hypothetical protein